MANFVKVISSLIDDLNRRVVKFYRLGKSDVQTALEAGPYGIDGNPIKDLIAVYAETGEKGKTVIVGYLNKNQLASVGEVRLFSTNTAGDLQFYIWLKNDGQLLLGGDADNLVRYTPLDTGLQQLVTFINQQLPLIAAGIATGGGSYTPGTAQLDISEAKIDEIKTL